jgi:hypothetical protein
MAGLDSIKHFENGGATGEVVTPSAGAIQTTAPKSTGITGKIALDPTQTESILANMQRYIDERQGPMNQLMGGINKARAGLAGPSALTAYQQQQNLEDKQTMDYRTQMAAYRAAQAQAANEAARYQGMAPGAMPAVGAQPTAAGGAQATAGGVPISAEQMAIENSFGTPSEKLESRRKYLAGRNTESAKREFAPGMADVVEIYVPGEGNVQMTKAQAEKLLNSRPNLQAIVGGNKVPAAQAIAAPAAPTTGGVNANNFGNVRPIGASTGFQQPKTPEEGLQILDNNLKAYGDKGINTLAGVISRWAPPSENDTQALIKAAAQRLSIDPNQPLDLKNPAVRQAIGTAIMIQEKGKGLFTGAPAAAAPAKTDETRAEYELRMAERKDISASRVKEGETARGGILQARESSIETGNAIGRIEAMLNTPEGNKAVGVFNKPGVVSAFGKILSEGVQAGNFGAVSFKGLEDAVRAAGGDQKTIDAAQSLARDFAQMQLNIAKRDLKGQGAVSDNERAIVAKVTGSTSNSPEVLKDFTRWNRVRNTFDKQVGDALQNWEEKNPNQSYTKFKQSAEYKQLENDYIAKTDAMAAKMNLGGKKAAPAGSGSNIDELLKQYTPKKAS